LAARPAPGADAAIVYSGAVAPEALAAWEALKDDLPGLGLLAITSPDLLHRGWSARQSARWSGRAAENSHIERLLGALSPKPASSP
jgi:pyruvate dehydrogenase E1 component